MIALSSIEMYNLLRDKIGEPQAKALTEYVENKVETKFERAKEQLATKEDIVRLKGDLEVKISDTKAELLKWMIVLFIPFYIGMIVFLIKNFI